MHARLRVAVCNGYDMCHPADPKCDFYILASDLKKYVKPGVNLSAGAHIGWTYDANWQL